MDKIAKESWAEKHYGPMIDAANSINEIDFILNQKLLMDGIKPGTLIYDNLYQRAQKRKGEISAQSSVDACMVINYMIKLANQIEWSGIKDKEYDCFRIGAVLDGAINKIKKMADEDLENLTLEEWNKRFERKLLDKDIITLNTLHLPEDEDVPNADKIYYKADKNKATGTYPIVFGKNIYFDLVESGFPKDKPIPQEKLQKLEVRKKNRKGMELPSPRIERNRRKRRY